MRWHEGRPGSFRATRKRIAWVTVLGLAVALAALPSASVAEPQSDPDEESLATLDDDWDPDGPLIAEEVVDSPTSWQPDLTPGYLLIEGDIQVPAWQHEALRGSAHPDGIASPNATFGTVNYWPNSVVPYDFVTGTMGAGDVSAANQRLAVRLMAKIRNQSGILFRAATSTDADRIRFQNSNFNNSPVGRQGGVQIINITNWTTPIVIAHEVYHSLGFWHEQSRPDRGGSVSVNTANVCGAGPTGSACDANVCKQCTDNAGNFTSCAFNFNVQAGALTFGSYDFDSFMHYGANAFSCNGKATITVNVATPFVIGQRDHFSYLDRITCRGIYPKALDRWVDPTWFGTQSGTFFEPTRVSNLDQAVTATPTDGTVFFKTGGTLSGAGIYTRAMTIESPAEPITLN